MKHKITYLPIGILTLATAVSGVALTSTGAAADTSGSRSAAVTVSKVCSFTSASSYTTNVSLTAGNSTTTESLTRTTNQIACNGSEGFKVQAVGFSNDTQGDTSMHSTAGTIPTGVSGTGSRWAFKVTSASGNSTTTIGSGYNNYSLIPSSPTDIVTYGNTSSAAVTGSFRTDYQIQAAATQASGTYAGAVKYIISLSV